VALGNSGVFRDAEGEMGPGAGDTKTGTAPPTGCVAWHPTARKTLTLTMTSHDVPRRQIMSLTLTAAELAGNVARLSGL
jgi:hypothetical protein